MKFFAVFAAILAVACGYQATWTLEQLSDALQNPTTSPALIPHLEHALNELMEQIWSGQPASTVVVSIPAIDFSTWTLHELSEAIQNPATDPAILPYLVEALNQMMVAIHEGQVMPVAPVVVPAMDVTLWSLAELSEALVNPQTNPALIPYLEHALNEIMEALMTGNNLDSVVVVTPAGLLPIAPEVIPEQVLEPVEEPAVPAPSASPLVQIIINVNAQAAGPAPSPAAIPDKPQPIKPEPVIVVDPVIPEPVIIPSPVIVSPEPVIVPSPVIVNPEVNPVDIISVNPGQVNPIDALHPVPVVKPVIVGGVGPMI